MACMLLPSKMSGSRRISSPTFTANAATTIRVMPANRTHAFQLHWDNKYAFTITPSTGTNGTSGHKNPVASAAAPAASVSSVSQTSPGFRGSAYRARNKGIEAATTAATAITLAATPPRAWADAEAQTTVTPRHKANAPVRRGDLARRHSRPPHTTVYAKIVPMFKSSSSVFSDGVSDSSPATPPTAAVASTGVWDDPDMRAKIFGSTPSRARPT
mmetsp:Transcript_6892/g.16947  ORF Transcript_6892/g.16947 Transcript_6892/m.16947 type:complete len:215 (-) Transcript_6892:309-953(-)